MKRLDGKNLGDYKQWKCSKNKDHVLGVIERVRQIVEVNGKSIKYYTTRLLIFRETVDLSAEVPAQIDVAGSLDGRALSMIWKCSVPGCGCVDEWHPAPGVMEYLVNMYLAE